MLTQGGDTEKTQNRGRSLRQEGVCDTSDGRAAKGQAGPPDSPSCQRWVVPGDAGGTGWSVTR